MADLHTVAVEVSVRPDEQRSVRFLAGALRWCRRQQLRCKQVKQRLHGFLDLVVLQGRLAGCCHQHTFGACASSSRGDGEGLARVNPPLGDVVLEGVGRKGLIIRSVEGSTRFEPEASANFNNRPNAYMGETSYSR